MKSLLKQTAPYFHIIARLFLGWVFFDSGWEKLHHLTDFYQDVLNYKLLPDQLAYFYGVCLPWFEILAGAYLILGLFIRFAASLSGLMMLSFIIALGYALATGSNIDCGCYVNGESSPVSSSLLIRDIGLFVLSGYLVWQSQSNWSLDHYLQDPQTKANKPI